MSAPLIPHREGETWKERVDRLTEERDALLEVLRDALAMVVQNAEAEHPQARDVVVRARAAIAKAEGRAP